MTASEALHKARELLTALTHRRGEVGRTAEKILALLDRAEDDLAGLRAGGPVTRPSKRGSGKMEYRVERTPGGETLAEHRIGGTSQPFRCPRGVYDAIVQALASATSPLSVEDIATEVKSREGVQPGDFQIRVPLRLWLQVEPALIIRHRARYRSVTPELFPAATRALWERLRSSPV